VRGSGRLRPPGVAALAAAIGSELTTLSVCDLDSNHRSVVSDAPGAISARQIEVFDRYFPAHPLVRAHARNPAAVTKRISDLVPSEAFLETPPTTTTTADRHPPRDGASVYVDRRLLVSFVLQPRLERVRRAELEPPVSAASREPVPTRGRNAPVNTAAYGTRARSARMGRGRQDQPRYRRDPRRGRAIRHSAHLRSWRQTRRSRRRRPARLL
jgi:hypothetical protein